MRIISDKVGITVDFNDERYIGKLNGGVPE
jgi:hypothetical protein